MGLAPLGFFFLLRHKRRGEESGRTEFPLKKQNHWLERALCGWSFAGVRGAETPEDAGGGMFQY